MRYRINDQLSVEFDIIAESDIDAGTEIHLPSEVVAMMRYCKKLEATDV